MADKKIADDMTDDEKQALTKEEIGQVEAEPKAKGGKKLAVRLRGDYWDADGVRHSASYVDKNGEFRETGAIIELPAEEARNLVKSGSAERGDDY